MGEGFAVKELGCEDSCRCHLCRLIVFTYLGYLFGIIRLSSCLCCKSGCHCFYSALVIVNTVVLRHHRYYGTEIESKYYQIAFHCLNIIVYDLLHILIKFPLGFEVQHMACLVYLLGKWQGFGDS